MSTPKFHPRGLHGGQPLLDLCNAFLSVSLRRERPPPSHRAHLSPERKPLLGREDDRCLCSCLGCRPFSAELMEAGSTAQGIHQAIGMLLLLGQRECLLAPRQGLVGITEQPQEPGYVG